MAVCMPVNAFASENITKENFDYVRYANDYQDLKNAFGYDANALYNHYLNNGKAEGRVAYRSDGSVIENQVETVKTAETVQPPVSPAVKKLIDEGWEWNSKWGKWVR